MALESLSTQRVEAMFIGKEFRLVLQSAGFDMASVSLYPLLFCPLAMDCERN